MTTYQILCGAVVVEAGVNDNIQFEENGDELSATIAPGTYYLYQASDGSDTAAQGNLLKAIADAMDTVSTSDGLGLSYEITIAMKIERLGESTVVTIAESSGTYTTKILSPANGTTFDMLTLGFPALDTAAALVLTSSLSSTVTWVPTQPVVILDPLRTEMVRAQHVAGDGSRYTFTASSPRRYRRRRWENECGDRIWRHWAGGDDGRTIEAWWEICGDGRTIRIYEAAAASSTTLADPDGALDGTVVLAAESLTQFTAERPQPGADLYSVELVFAEDV